MRTSGVTDVVVGLHPHDHPCRPFDGFTQVSAHAAKSGIGGLQSGRRAGDVTPGSVADRLSDHSECVR